MIKKIFLPFSFMLFFLFLNFDDSQAEDFCVDNVTSLQDSLDAAASNSQDDIIQIVKGTYNGNFYFFSNEGMEIIIRGGYEKSGTECQFPAPLPLPSETILDGGGLNNVLRVSEDSGGNIIIERLTIRNGNTEGDAGGLLASSNTSTANAGDVSVSYNIIEGNRANRFGGVWADSYSGQGNAGSVTLAHNIIRNNSAINDYGGGGVRSESNLLSGSLIVSDNTITNNETANGKAGGLYVHSNAETGSGNVKISNNLISGNSSDGYGGGAHIISRTVSGVFSGMVLTNNIVTGNHSNDSGGGLYVLFSPTSITGGISFIHNTLFDNSANVSGGGVELSGMSNNYTVNVYNNIIWGNIAPDGGDIKLTEFQVSNGYNNDYEIMSGSWDNASDNINQNPKFIGGGDYHLQPFSPCRDAGTADAPSMPTFDIDGENRTMGIAPDIGADECLVNVGKGDVNYDDNVDLIDVIISLRIVADMDISAHIFIESDVNEDEKIGTEEAIFGLNKFSEDD